MSSDAAPQPKRTKSTRDMVLTMLVTLVVVAGIAIYGFNVSFSPTGKPVVGEIPSADVMQGFDHAQRTMPFEVAVPRAVPHDWQGMSFTMSTSMADGPGTIPTVRGGWATATGAYVTVIQAQSTTSALLRDELNAAGSQRGTVTVSDVEWTITDGVRNEVAWVKQIHDVALLITGNATEEDFHTLANSLAPSLR